MPVCKELGSHCLNTYILAYMEIGGCLVAEFDTVLVFTKEGLKMAMRVKIQTSKMVKIIETKCSWYSEFKILG